VITDGESAADSYSIYRTDEETMKHVKPGVPVEHADTKPYKYVVTTMNKFNPENKE